MHLRNGFNTRSGHTRRLGREDTSCPPGTRCFTDHLVLHYEGITLHHEGRRCVQLFRDDNLDSAFSPQYVDADILRITFKREVNGGVPNPEILDLNMLQKRRQDRLRKGQAGQWGLNSQTETRLKQQK